MPRSFPTRADFEEHLDRLNFFHMDLSLSRMDRTLEALDLKRPPYAVVQICGTNGKGSTASFLAELLRAHDLKAGLYTSPHFVSPEERIQINGEWTDMDDWLDAAGRAVSLCPELTYFELLTVIALDVFRQEKVDVAVLEAGLGARHDATTATAADTVLYAPIALDHTLLLGDTVAAIAGEKSHAIRSSAPVVTAPQSPEAQRVLEERARLFQAPFYQARPLDGSLPLGLAGRHQLVNAGTALEGFKTVAPLLGLAVSEDCVRRGLAQAFIPGRLQILPPAPPQGSRCGRPSCVLDGTHNPHGMRSLASALKAGLCPRPETVVYSSLADKDWRGALNQLAELLPGADWRIPAIPGERSEKPENILAFLRSLGHNRGCVHQDLASAFAALKGEEGTVLVTGSLYLLSEFFALWPEALHPQCTSARR